MKLQNINQVSMTSLEIAELTGKLHKNVLRDIRNMFKELKIEPTVFIGYFEDKNGDKQPFYKLSKEYALCLTSGYSAILRLKIIRKVEELSQALIQPTYAAHNMIIAQNVEQLIQDDQKYKEYASECGRQLEYLKKLNAMKKESLQRILDFAQKELALF